MVFQTNSVFSPRNRNILLGTPAGGDYSLSYMNASRYLVRGYPVGEFLGWSLASGTLEYRLPLNDRPGDFGTFPAIFRRWHAGVFVDAVTLDGIYYDSDIKGAKSTALGRFYYSTGVEFRSDITFGYHVPAVLKFGLYYGLNNNAYGGFTTAVTLSLPRF